MDLQIADGFKLVELIITVLCFGLHINETDGGQRYMESVVYIMTYVGFLVILIGKLTGIVTEERLDPVPDTLLNVVGVAFNVAAGSILLEHYASIWYSEHLRAQGLTKGALSIINAAVICIDIGFVTLT